MKKKIILIVASIFVVVALVAGVTYAFYSANVNRINESQTVVKTNNLTLTYTGGQEINVSGIVPGDSFTKTFTVENTSNIAVDYNIYLENITNEFNEDLVYTLSDETGNVIEETVLPVSNTGKEYLMASINIAASITKEYTLKITYKYSDDDQNAYQGASFSATLGVDTVKIEEPITWTLTNDENGNGHADVGDLITYKTESFYVISNDDTNIKALAQYNLYVGGSYDGTNWTEYGEEATGIQDSSMLGYISGQSLRKGTTAFSSDEQKGTNYSDYSGSIVEEYVNTYKTKLEEFGATIDSASLITKEELESLGCFEESYSCSSALAFVFTTSYWTISTTDNPNVIWSVGSSGSFNIKNYIRTDNFGVRPVITISATELI